MIKRSVINDDIYDPSHGQSAKFYIYIYIYICIYIYIYIYMIGVIVHLPEAVHEILYLYLYDRSHCSSVKFYILSQMNHLFLYTFTNEPSISIYSYQYPMNLGVTMIYNWQNISANIRL